MNQTPIKRSEHLKPFSREHHHILLFGWKIREGLKRKIDPARIANYANWFWEKQLKPHFEAEEKYVFSILQHDQNILQEAIDYHRKISGLFESLINNEHTLSEIARGLDDLTRFEERILFNKVQEAATDDQLNAISEAYASAIDDNWQDEFWAE